MLLTAIINLIEESRQSNRINAIKGVTRTIINKNIMSKVGLKNAGTAITHAYGVLKNQIGEQVKNIRTEKKYISQKTLDDANVNERSKPAIKKIMKVNEPLTNHIEYGSGHISNEELKRYNSLKGRQSKVAEIRNSISNAKLNH